MSDHSKLELFRQEVETQVSILKEVLPILKTQPLSMLELGQAIQAVHSVWGTARIVKMEATSNLAQLIKECLIAAQNKTVTLGDEQIDVLLHAGDLLLGMSRAVEGELERWMTEHSWDLATTQKTISIVLSSGATMMAVPPIQASEVSTEVSSFSQETIVQATSSESVPKTTLLVPSDKGGHEEIAIANPSNPTITTTPTAPSVVTATLNTVITTTPTAPSVVTATLNGDDSMMELFRLEAEAQVAILNEGLLALESNSQSTQALETLMRAAHSIKGAARIVGLDALVNLAHVMEDCFVAAQNKTVVLSPDCVDVLLQGVDLLQGIGQVSDAELPRWLAEHNSEFEITIAAITAILTPGAAPKLGKGEVIQGEAENVVSVPRVSVVPTISESSLAEIPNGSSIHPTSEPTVIVVNQPESSPSGVMVQERPERIPSSSSASEQATTQDRVVRVSAENLNRIMGLAGESLIEANWLQPYADSMMSLKRRMVELSRTLEQLQDSLERGVVYQQEGKEYLEEARNQEQECLDFLGDRLGELELYAQRTANLSDRLYREVITSHMRPFADGVQGFPRMIRDLARKLNKQVRLEIVGKATSVDRDILKKLEAPLTHILRNATDHGIELPDQRTAAGKPPEGMIRLEAFHRGGMLAITISDDGRGINPEQLRQKVVNKNLATSEMAVQLTDAELMEFLFLPGFSTAKQVTEISGRGVGLDIAKSMAQEVGGTVRAMSQPGKGTSFHFQLPLTLSVVRTLLVEISGKPYAVPLARIDQIVTVERSDISDVENRQYFTMNQQNIGLITAHQVLELPEPPPNPGSLSVVVISDQSNPYGLVVDKFLGERDLVVRPLDPRLGKVPDISATSLMGDGSPILIVDVSDMVRSIDAILNAGRLAKVGVDAAEVIADKRKKVLVVDDSITVREMERKLLENRGYSVDVAVNGMEGWNAVRTNHYDLVISDIDMPRMNGIELVKQMKNHPRLHSTPVIIVSYRDREEDRIQGLEAGADYYLTKSSFHDATLIDAVVNLIGR
ncbi:hybrid sensor histidine kinase/response regulator [Trichocoleus sp. DQ-U1]|uniref:hybrid sensor histidine kinase/response regulator n=1 Tax=Trichocoleus sp. DQ-U1 TaxID=2933926 RepID=UPI003296BFC7